MERTYDYFFISGRYCHVDPPFCYGNIQGQLHTAIRQNSNLESGNLAAAMSHEHANVFDLYNLDVPPTNYHPIRIHATVVSAIGAMHLHLKLHGQHITQSCLSLTEQPTAYAR